MKYFLLAALSSVSFNSFGQNSAGMPSGNIGIGTIAPAVPLHVKGSGGFVLNLEATGNISGLNIVNTVSGKHLGLHYTTDGTDNVNTNSLRFGRYSSAGWESNPVLFDMDAPDGSFVLSQDGKIGIGNPHPEGKLDVLLSAVNEFVNLRSSNGFVRLHSTNMGQSAYNGITLSGDAGIIFGNGITELTDNGFVIAPWNNAISGIRIDKRGNVGIGTSNTSDLTYSLFVEKGIRTRKVKVDQASWADFVFAPSYKLQPLNELKSFIKQNHHLPDVPSEKEIMESGQDLGEMNKILLQKIEELTLYLIQQDEKIIELQKEVKNMHRSNK